MRTFEFEERSLAVKCKQQSKLRGNKPSLITVEEKIDVLMICDG